MLHLKNQFPAAFACLFAVAVLTLFPLAGCRQTSKAPATGDASAPKAAQDRPAKVSTPEANVFVDEALLAKPYAVIGGAVENIGAQRLEKLSVEIELRRRADGSLEKREVPVEPGDLEPGKKGKFSLKVLSDEWSGSRVVKLRSAARPQEEVAFQAQPGAKRPPERMKDNIIIVKTPGQKKPGDSDFINTPDTPYKVP